MRRLIVPALAAALLTLAGCGAADETGTLPEAAPRTDAAAADTALETKNTAPAGAAADVVDANLRVVTIDVEGMG